MAWDPFGSKAAKDAKKMGKAQSEAARAVGIAQAKTHAFNAAVLQENADVVAEQGLIDEQRTRRQGSRLLGEQIAAINETGFQQVGFDDMQEDTREELDLDAIIVRRQGQFQAADYLAQSELSLMSADTAIQTGETNAKNAILEGNMRARSARSQATAQTIGMATSIGGTAAGIYFSDRRVKQDIERVGTTPGGLPFYRFRFIWSDQIFRGVMADEVQAKYPDAVSKDESSGMLTVDYGRIS